jgi:hypothetical protein
MLSLSKIRVAHPTKVFRRLRKPILAWEPDNKICKNL